MPFIILTLRSTDQQVMIPTHTIRKVEDIMHEPVLDSTMGSSEWVPQPRSTWAWWQKVWSLLTRDTYMPGHYINHPRSRTLGEPELRGLVHFFDSLRDHHPAPILVFETVAEINDKIFDAERGD